MNIRPASTLLYTILYIIGGMGIIVADRYYEHSIVGTVILVVAIFIFSMIMMYQVTKPLCRLARHIEALKKDPDKRLDTNFAGLFSFKEFSIIANSLNEHQEELVQLHKDLKRRNVALVETSRKDPLTGIHNRRAYDEDWDLLERGKVDADSIALMLIDCDNFKTINDTYGHDAGDRVLESVASLLSRTVSKRRGDRVYRLGGDEFVIVLKNANNNETFGIAARCAEEIKDHDFVKFGIKHPVEISVGFASTKVVCRESLHQLKRKADMAMYRAKSTEGRHVVQYDTAMGM